MAIQDTDPERRNLMVTSLGFIAYYYGGGELLDSTVRIQVVNIKFDHPEVLAIMVWLLLLWFGYRYWLTHSRAFREHFLKEIKWWTNTRYNRRYLERVLDKKFVKDSEEGYHIVDLKWKNFSLWLDYRYARKVSRPREGREISGHSESTASSDFGEVRLKGFRGFIITLRVLLECAFAKSSFSNFAVPYILFVLAIAGGGSREASKIF